MIKCSARWWLLATALGLGACASKDGVIPPSDKTMNDIYEAHMGKTQGGVASMSRFPCPEGMAPWTREQVNEHQNLFPRLRNPDLVMYVFPHLGESGAPVPGYSTVFPLYEQVEYALPGEEAEVQGGCFR